MFEYKDYLQEFDTITVEECEHLYHMLRESIDTSDEDEVELFQDLLESIVVYSHVRAQWYMTWTRSQRMAEDSLRTANHDSMIQNFDILARYQESKGTDTTWRTILGERERRKRIGDFGCYIAFIYSINAR